MNYYAHKREEDGEKQLLRTHLQNVAEQAESFSVDLLKPLVYRAGIGHDLGKYSMAFAKRLDGAMERYEHSTAGGIEYKKLAGTNQQLQLLYTILEYCIVGHHTGLPDGGTPIDTWEESTLQGRLKKEKHYYVGKDRDYSAYQQEIGDQMPVSISDLQGLINVFQTTYKQAETMKKGQAEFIEKYAFFTRYVFSCLTDADFLDTERFCEQEVNRTLKADFEKALSCVDEWISSCEKITSLQKARGRIQKQAYGNMFLDGNVSILDMPTGSGKTLCSIKIALEKLLRSGGKYKRIIYVIPYVSIIEQTADLFGKILGKYIDIVQHHSNYCPVKDVENRYNDMESVQEKLKMATENWDAPLVITTSVQFFESVYHYRGSGLRKFHNMGNSIIIFDEIHMLPIEMLQPCLRAVGYITKYLNSEAVFLSATMPDYVNMFNRYMSGKKMEKISFIGKYETCA